MRSSSSRRRRLAPAGVLVAAALAAPAVAMLAGGEPGPPGVPHGPPPAATPSRAGDLFALERVACRPRTPVQVLADPARDGRLLVVERAGVIRDLSRCDDRDVVLDIRSLVGTEGEQGLLSATFGEPGESLYVHHSDRAGDTVVARYAVRGGRAAAAGRRELLTVEQPYDNHNGGSIAFGPDGRLYLGLGDGGGAFDRDDNSQDPGTRLGKLLRHDPAAPAGRWEIAATGLRNPWRFAFDAATGDLWIGDVGQDRAEEVNRIPRAQLATATVARPPNLGWPAYEGRERMPGRRLARAGRLLLPVATYGHAGNCSITGGFVYRGRAIPRLRGRYLYGDFCSGRLWSLGLRGGRPDIRQEAERVPQLVSLDPDARGEPYAVSMAGTVHRLVPPRG